MEELFGLPAHPLIVHFPVVAIPAFTLMAFAMVISPSFRRRYGQAISLFGIVTTIATILAAQSGQAFLDTFFNPEPVDKHKSLGETLRLFVLGLTLAVIASTVLIRREGSSGKEVPAVLVSVSVLVLAILSTVWTIRTGHEGARLTWGS